MRKYNLLFTRFSKFATIGAVLTVLTQLCNFICLRYFLFPLLPTYILIYTASIYISFVLNSKYTYNSKINLTNTLKYYTIYLSSLCLGALLLIVFETFLSFESWVYPLMVLPFTILYNFTFTIKELSLNNETR